MPRGRTLDFARVKVMGVLNVTPDSFSDGGRWLRAADAVRHALSMEAAGAAIIDVGGESTRPGAEPVAEAEQIARVRPVVRGIRDASDVAISIDTTSAAVAAEALDAGADLVNDISAFRYDPAMIPLIVGRGVPAVAMHVRGTPRDMQREPEYRDVAADVIAHLEGRVASCVAAGMARSQLILDPGIGFGKTVAHNLSLLRELPRLVALGQPVLVGTSRKSFLGRLTGKPVGQRLAATAASCAAAIALGAHIVRVHDVAELKDTLTVADAIRNGQEQR